MMVESSFVDCEECQLEYVPLEKRSTTSALRRALLVALGLAAFVAGAFVLTQHDESIATSFRRRLTGTDDSEVLDASKATPSEQAWIDEMLPKVLMAQQRANSMNGMFPQQGHGGSRRLQSSSIDDDEVYIGMDVNTHLFYIVNVMNGLGKYVCAITKSTRCNSIYSMPHYIEVSDITGLLQGLRDSDDGLDQIKTFDQASLDHANALIEQGARAARDEVDHLKTIFDVSTALTSVQIAGNIAGAILSVTPFTFAGAFMSMAVNIGVELIEKFVTAQEIEDAENSVAAAVLNMGDKAEKSPKLAYLQKFHDAENVVSIKMGKLYAGGPLAIAAGSDQVVLRRFMTGLARATDSIADMHELLIDFHNAFTTNPMQNFKLWKDVSNSMINVDHQDVDSYQIMRQSQTSGVNEELFSGMSGVLLMGGTASARKAKMWSKQTYAYRSKTNPNIRTARLMKLRALSENSVATRKATKYSRMTAGLNIMSAVVSGIGLGFKVAKQNDLIAKLSQSIVTQRLSLRKYYQTVYDTILAVEDAPSPVQIERPVPVSPSPTAEVTLGGPWDPRMFVAEEGRRL